jgi:hypothetical protein
MKQQLSIVLLTVILTVTGCENKTQKENVKTTDDHQIVKNKSSEQTEKEESNKLLIEYDESKESLKAYYELPHMKEFYAWQEMGYAKPPALTYPEDLSTLSYEELRLLRNEIFARNGYLFSDGYLRGYFNRYKWYMPVFDVDTFKVVLNQEERKLIDALLAEESKRKEKKRFEKDGLEIYNAELISNNKQFKNVPSKIMEDFQHQNFSIVNANRAMPFFVYDKNAYQYIPHYITTDLYLFILHKYFSRFLEKLDENHLYVQLSEILKSTSTNLQTLTSSTNEASIEWAKTYNAIALYAIGDSLAESPAKYSVLFSEEKQKIDAEKGSPSFIPSSFVDYNELKPRGHYTKSDKLKKYFRGFKWISLNGIDLGNDEQLKGLLTFAYTIKSDTKLHQQYNQYVITIEKIAGVEDNLSIADLVNAIDSSSLDNLLTDKNISSVRKSLNDLDKEKIKKVFGESYPTPEKEIKRVFFLSSTYSISGDIFSKLVDIDFTNSKRPFPKALDIPAVFGNKTAQDIIITEYKDNEVWPGYLPRLKKLQGQFSKFSDWDSNYGYKGVETALSAYAEKGNYPDFMKTDAYNRKELSTTLSSWTHIKHDLILYQEKPYAAEAGQGGGPEPPKHYSYVEPNIVFWESALELIEWLENLASKESTFNDELQRIKDLGKMLRDISKKELNDQEITKEEYQQLHYIGGTIEYILLGLLETDHLPDREKSMALITDVYIYNGENLNVAVGHADDIYVVVPIEGEYYIARGSVFSYFEFNGKIYNDEEWRAKVNNNNVPERPDWIKPLINNEEPLKGQMQFRYPGHGMY